MVDVTVMNGMAGAGSVGTNGRGGMTRARATFGAPRAAVVRVTRTTRRVRSHRRCKPETGVGGT